MPKRPRRPRDPAQLAKLVVDIATGQTEEPGEVATSPVRRRAGRKGGQARARLLTAEQRQDIARVAAEARWKKGR